MKKKLVSFLSGCLIVSLFAGCGSGSSGDDNMVYIEDDEETVSDDEEIEITFFGFKTDTAYMTAIEDALQGYMEENPSVRISYEGIKSADYWDALDARGENNNLDNIFMVHHDDVVELSGAGRLADLSDLTTISNFSEMAQSQFIEEDGSVYFLPTQISTFNLYVNETLLAENDLEVPTNWDEFEDVCDYFVEKGTVPIIGNNFTTCRALIAAKGLYSVYQMEDPAEMIEKFNSGEEEIMDYLSEGVELVGEMFDRGWFDKEEMINTNPTSDDLALFAEGDRPFMITGGWASQRVMELEPEFTYGIYPFPILETGSVLVMNVDSCISVSEEADNLDITNDFVEYLTQPDIIADYCNTQSSYTPLEDDREPEDETIAPSVPYLFNGQSVIGADYRLNLPIDTASNEVGVDMMEGMSTEDAIAKMAELIHQ